MPDQVFKKIRKRSGRLHKFNPAKIERAISAAGQVTGEFDDKIAKKLMIKVLRLAHQMAGEEENKTPTVEEIQDLVEEVLLGSPYNKTAKEYIIFREKKDRIKEISANFNRDLINQYLRKEDWQVKENSNMGFSLQGLNNYMSSELSKVYWLNEIYPKEIRDAHIKGDFHIHDLSAISVYCVGWDLWDLLVEGFTGVPEKTESKPAKHLRTALGQIVNFFYTLQGEAAGAQAFSNLDTLLAPFIRYDKLTYKEVKQTMQEFVFNINVPTRVGFQCNDELTEILTADGWRTYDKVDLKKPIATYNLVGKKIEYLPIKNFFVRQYDGPMYHLTGAKVDQLVSPKHRVVYRKSNGQDTMGEVEDVVKRKIINVPIRSESGNANGNDGVNEAVVKLVAYLISEGTIDKNGKGTGRISLIQSKQEHPDVYNEIKSILDALGLTYTVREQTGWGSSSVFRLNAESSQFVYDLFESDKHNGIKFIPQQILELSPRLSKLFLETYLKGDGSLEELKTTTVVEGIRDGLMAVGINAGYGVSTYTVPVERLGKNNRQDLMYVKFTESEVSLVQNVEEVDYKGVIWCPNTDNETVIARRNGKVFITGNTPFTNITLDLNPSPVFKDQNVIIGGKPQEEKYGDFQKEMDWFNRAFFEVMLEGDARGRVFTFPIPTYNITRDFDWDNPNISLLWDITARYGIPYFSNFINSDMKPEDARSMCCRLRLNVKELATRGGGLFGANPLTGSIGVVTINMPRLAHTSETGVDFMKNLGKLMDQAKESLEIKRKVLEEFTDNDLYPYARFYLRSVKKRFHKYWANHFSTIGLVGVNEACLNLLGEDISTNRGKKFASKILDYMRDRLVAYQKETGNNYNLEATPAEGTAYRLALKDKEADKSIICANEQAYQEGAEPFYTNSTQLPVGHTDDIFEVLDLQDSLQVKYTGGTVMHLFIGEKIDDPEAVKKLVKVICENYHMPYFTITPTFSICPKHGYMAGEHRYCPKCDEDIVMELDKKDK